MLTAGGYYLYLKGYHYEILQPDRYGSLVASARIPASYKDPEDIYIAAVLYREVEGELVRIDNADFRFRAKQNEQQEDSYLLESERLYLETGRYRLKVNLEGQLYWESFFLGSRSLQKHHLDTSTAQRVEIQLEQTPSLPLEVRYTVSDIRSDEDLSESTTFFIFINESWVRWNRRIANSLTTGASYRFKFERAGYYPQTFNLGIKPYQPLLQLQVHLIPYPGTLKISSDADGLQILLDDSSAYQSGGRDRIYQDLESLEAGARELILDPGEYLLTVKRDDQLSRSLPVTVLSEKTVQVNVHYDKSAKVLEVAVE